MKVNKQVLVAFSIGKYNDEVLCDVNLCMLVIIYFLGLNNWIER